jgi:hypothetical protein
MSSSAFRSRQLRKSAIEALGGKCVQCGFTDVRALQIDHVNGGGVKHIRATSSATRYGDIIKSVLKGEKIYQLLCANCNWIKKAVNDENPYR